jgi:hypothetical protein
MPQARIYKMPKSAMQSGLANTQKWIFEYEQTTPKTQDPLMGWTSSADTTQQVKLNFDNLDDAKAYADRHKIVYSIVITHDKTHKPKSYCDNFSFNRKVSWTH